MTDGDRNDWWENYHSFGEKLSWQPGGDTCLDHDGWISFGNSQFVSKFPGVKSVWISVKLQTIYWWGLQYLQYRIDTFL